MQLNDFYNEGFGWICRQCDPGPASDATDDPPRFFREGEAESKSPDLATPALARWANPERTTLVCPRCGTTEAVDVP